ncbi:TonB-dependent receptor [Echinimonas agarilytica]|uniref:TonB-dependent receptor n=1 Tax=Echinimonas agarilytica TaxID=1215918 RepID=A0AA41W672_9GAMM|nr:TonB-dependent receptor [Echinimonas agarilytica]MCM2679366.1 TonB-dependent receptor [Echinimonas agarilytica]
MQNAMKPKLLSLAVASVLSATSYSALAQEAEAVEAAPTDETTEVIQVTGIRGSLNKAADIKRSSAGVVDAISSEDIGKFPDTNLAESLQRITGVSIDRQNNEGNRVTVRGFGPDFNLVTLNGRTMPTAATDRNVNSSRAFNFNEIASESVSGVEVYKTAKARNASGGIGATINIQTRKPFDFDETKYSFSAKGVHDTTVEKGDNITPDISGMFSTKFADDTFGILVAASYQKRDNREEISASDGWLPENLNAIPRENLNFANPATEHYWMPQNFNVDVSDHERERINGQVVLQWAPIDSVEVALDYTMSRFEDEIERNQLGVWFNGGGGITGDVDANGTVTKFTQTDSNVDFFGYSDKRETENDSIGLNIKWQVNDGLDLVFDAHSSTSEAQPDKNANETFAITGVGNVGGVTMDYGLGTDIPGMSIDLLNAGNTHGYTDSLYDQENIGSLFVASNGTYQKTDVDQFKLAGTWLNDGNSDLNAIRFGADYTKYETNTQRRQSQRSTGYYNANFPFASRGNVDTDGWELIPLNGLLSDFSKGPLPEYLYRYDVDAHINQLESLWYDDHIGESHPAYGETITEDYLTTFNDGNLIQNHFIEEKTYALYTSFDFQSEFNGMPLNVLAGVRYERTEVNGSSLAPEYTHLRWNSGNEMAVTNTGEEFFTDRDSSYTEFLPSLDMDIEIVEDVIARFSYSNSMARPDLNAMRETVAIGETKAFGNLNANAGNSALKPYLAQNFDLSLEWYYDEGSYVAAGYFKKIVENFIVNTSSDQEIAGLTDPAFGPDAEAAKASVSDPSVQGDVLAALQGIRFAAGTCGNAVLGLDPATGGADCAIIGLDSDPLASFNTTAPQNGEDAKVDGWEIALQHMFWDSGFGIQTNATFVDGDVDYDVTQVGEAFALTGLSDSANFVAFYDKDGIQVRAAYNWRDEFLAGIGQLRVSNEPVFTEAYGQLDLNASYDINENLTVFFEGINVLEEEFRQHGRYDNQLVRAEQYGARYAIGIRGTY